MHTRVCVCALVCVCLSVSGFVVQKLLCLDVSVFTYSIYILYMSICIFCLYCMFLYFNVHIVLLVVLKFYIFSFICARTADYMLAHLL